MSTFTSVSMVERDLDRDGIDNAEIKPVVVQRLVRNFDNSAVGTLIDNKICYSSRFKEK